MYFSNPHRLSQHTLSLRDAVSQWNIRRTPNILLLSSKRTLYRHFFLSLSHPYQSRVCSSIICSRMPLAHPLNNFPANMATSGILKVVPAWLRNPVYDIVAAHRYQWFGRTDSCQIPSPGLRDRFLDWEDRSGVEAGSTAAMAAESAVESATGLDAVSMGAVPELSRGSDGRHDNVAATTTASALGTPLPGRMCVVKRKLDGAETRFDIELWAHTDKVVVGRWVAVPSQPTYGLSHGTYSWGVYPLQAAAAGVSWGAYRLHTSDHALLGYRFDVLHNVRVTSIPGGGCEVVFDDLLLDFRVSPDGVVTVEDEDELIAAAQSETLSPALVAQIRWLERQFLAQPSRFTEEVDAFLAPLFDGSGTGATKLGEGGILSALPSPFGAEADSVQATSGHAHKLVVGGNSGERAEERCIHQ